MFSGIMTILFGVLFFVMMTQPVLWCYGDSKLVEFTNEGYKDLSCYKAIDFESIDNTYWKVGAGFLIAALVFAGILMLLVLLNLIGKAVNKKAYVGMKWIAFLFFICMAVATIMFVVYANGQFADINTDGHTISIGYGLIVCAAASLLAFIFSPRKSKK